MDLYQRLLQIQEEQVMGTVEFIEKSGFSKGFYYDISNGRKTKLKPLQAQKIHEAFPDYSYNWLLGNENEEEPVYSVSPFITKKMSLYDRLLHIQLEERVQVIPFIEAIGFSQGLYYNIKGGKKTKLKPMQAKKINEAYPKYSYNWIMGINEENVNNEVKEPPANYNQLTKNGIRQTSLTIVDNEELFLKDPVFNNWYEKGIAQEAIKLLAEIYSQTIMKK